MIEESHDWIQINNFIDYKDRTEDIVAALIIFINQKAAKIRLQGWSNKSDQICPINSHKIKPFRSLTRGYTGPLKSEGTRQHWTFTKQDHEKRLQYFMKFVQQLSQKNQHQINQFLRGHHYFYIDFLWTCNYSSKIEIQMVYNYFKAHLDFVRQFFKSITKERINQEFNNKQNSQQAKSAYFEGYYQYLDPVYTIMGKQARLSKFLKANNQFIRPIVIQNQVITHYAYFSKYINENGLLNAFIDAIKNLQLIDPQINLPLPFLQAIQKAYNGIQDSIQKDSKKKVVLMIFNIVKTQLQKIKQIKIKNVQKMFEKVLDFFLKIFSRYQQRDQVALWVEQTKLNFHFQMIQTDSLEKRLKGLKKIKQFFQQITKSAYSQVKMTNQMFQEWMKSKQIFKIIFQHNQHTQTIRKGSQFALSLYNKGGISSQQMLYIWNTCKSKHQAIKKLIFSMWQQLIFSMRQCDISKFVNVVLQTQFQNQGEKKFLFQYSLRFIKKWQSKQQAKKIIDRCYEQTLKNTNHYYFIRFMSQVIQQSNAKKYNTVSIFLTQCLTKIQEKNNLVTHCSLFYQIFYGFCQKNFIVNIPINTLKILIQAIKKSIDQLHEQTIIKTLIKIIDQIISCKYNEINFQCQDFLELWNIFHQMTRNSNLKQLFYQWVLRISIQGTFHQEFHQINPNFTPQLQIYIFKEILLNNQKLDYVNISLKEFQIFMEFFIQVNIILNNIQKCQISIQNCKFYYQILTQQIFGLKQLWEIFLNCRNQQVMHLVTMFIKNLYLNVSNKKLSFLSMSKIQSLLQNIQIHFKEGIQKSKFKLIKNSLMLLSRVMSDLKGQFNHVNIPHYNTHQIINATVFSSMGIAKKVPIDQYSSLQAIRNAIAKSFDIAKDSFRLVLKDVLVPRQFYAYPYYLFSNKIEFIKIVEQDHSVRKKTQSFLKEKLHNQLVQLLSNEDVSKQAFEILQDIPLTNQDNGFIKKIVQNDTKLGSQTIYFNWYFLRIFNYIFKQNPLEDLQPFIKFTKQVSIQVTSILSIGFIYTFLDMARRIYSKQANMLHQFQAQIILKSILSQIKFMNNQQKPITKRQNKYFSKFNNLFICYFDSLQVLLPQTNIFKYLLNKNFLQQFLTLLFINHKYDSIKEITKEKFVKYLEMISFQVEEQQKLAKILIQKIYPIIQRDKAHNHRHGIFFQVFVMILSQISSKTIQQLINYQNSLLQQTKNIIFKEKPQSEYQVNVFLQGHLRILNVIYKKCPEKIDMQMAKYLLYQCLFYDKGSSQNSKVKCNSQPSIKAVLDIFLTFCKFNNEIHSQIVKFLFNLHTISYWRDSNKWHVNVKDDRKSTTGYVGLENPGCICYLNSFIQQLFMFESFRNEIIYQKLERLPNKQYQLLDSLKILFLKLRHSESQYLSPIFFAQHLKYSNNTPIVNICEQMDIDQFRVILFDRLEEYLSSENNFVRRLFGGLFSNEVISKQCHHRSQRQQSFLSISLDVKNNIQDCFQSLVQGQMLEGENSYFCQQCNKKVRALKRLSIKKLPQHLFIVLKRFQFDFDMDCKKKINEYCQFPSQLNLKNYSYQKMNDDDHRQQNEQDQQSSKESENKECYKTLKQTPSNYFDYKLKGFVIHAGYADSGHYISYVEDKHGRWYQFNDDKVSQFEKERIPQQAYGGKDKDGQNLKIRNAYLLVYQRKKINTKQQMELQNGNHHEAQSPQLTQIIQQILDQNRILQKQHVLFTEQYSSFMNQLIELTIKKENQNQNILINADNHLEQARASLFISYFLNIKIRSHPNKQYLKGILKFAENILNMLLNNEKIAIEFIKHMSNHNILQEFFRFCGNSQKSRLIAQIIVQVGAKYLYPNLSNSQVSHVKENSQTTDKTPLNGLNHQDQKIINSNSHSKSILSLSSDITCKDMFKIFIDSALRTIITHQLNFTFLCYTLRKLAKINPQISQYLTSVNILNLLWDNLSSVSNASQKYRKMSVLECEIQPEAVYGTPSQNQIYAISRVNQKQSWHLMYDILLFMLNGDKKQKALQFQAKYKSMPTQKITQLILNCVHSKAIVANTYFNIQIIKVLPQNLFYFTAILEKSIKDLQSSKYRQFLFLLQHIILIDDQYKQTRTRKIIIILKVVLLHNEQYFNQSDVIFQWILKICDRSEYFAKILSQSKLFDDFIRIGQSVGLPKLDTLKKHRNPNCERLSLRLHHINVSSEIKDYEQAKARKFKDLANLKKNTYKSKHLYKQYILQQVFDVGCRIQFYTDMQWYPGEVIQNKLGHLTIKLDDPDQNNENQEYYVWDYDDNIKFVEAGSVKIHAKMDQQ